MAELPMTDFQIVQEYKLAKNKTEQIKILADENVCEPRVIAQILFDAGQRLPQIWHQRLTSSKPRHRKEESAPEPTMEPAGDDEPAAPPVAREELEQVTKQVADLQGHMEDTRQAVVTLCDSLVASANEKREKRLTVCDIKTAFFDIMVDELESDDDNAAKRASILIAIETVRQLLKRLEAQP